VSATFFRVLGVSPILGRTLSDTEDHRGRNRVVVISHSLWRTRYGGSPGVLGKTIVLDGKGFAIIGVLPATFRFSTTPEDVWTPLAGLLDSGPGGCFLNVIACVKPDVTLAQAQADMATVAAQFSQQFPEWSRNENVVVEPLRDRYTRELRPALLTLQVAAGLVLLIACVNLANLLPARATSRHKEIAVRRALGGRRTRIMRQLLTEGLLLAGTGGATGLVIAVISVRVLYATLPTGWQPLTRGGIDATVFAFALAASFLTVFLFGIAPAWNMTGVDLNEALKDSRRSSFAGASRQSFRGGLDAPDWCGLVHQELHPPLRGEHGLSF
jgi:predicted permease